MTPHSPGTITNQADVTSDAHDPASGNNSASEGTTVNRLADLSISKTDSPDPAVAGEQVTYTLTAHNAGPSSAPGTVVTDTLPGGITYESATPCQGTCTHPPGIVSCSLGTLASGADATITILLRPTGAGSLTNQASIASDATDPNTSNNTASAVTTVSAAVGYPRPIGRHPAPRAAGPGLRELHRAQRIPRAAARERLVQAAGAGLELPDGRDAGRERRAGQLVGCDPARRDHQPEPHAQRGRHRREHHGRALRLRREHLRQREPERRAGLLRRAAARAARADHGQVQRHGRRTARHRSGHVGVRPDGLHPVVQQPDRVDLLGRHHRQRPPPRVRPIGPAEHLGAARACGSTTAARTASRRPPATGCSPPRACWSRR